MKYNFKSANFERTFTGENFSETLEMFKTFIKGFYGSKYNPYLIEITLIEEKEDA
tara:strand:- start:24 stop:188 length:165 start_codon:yes stop_codon:yes gene_type:complete